MHYIHNVFIPYIVLCSHLLSCFQVPQAAEKMEVLQSHLVDLFPPEKEEDDLDEDEDYKQLMAVAPFLA